VREYLSGIYQGLTRQTGKFSEGQGGKNKCDWFASLPPLATVFWFERHSFRRFCTETQASV